jgi:hypothetical protein
MATAAVGAPRLDQSLECELSQLTDRETLGQQYFLSAPVQMTRQDAEGAPLFVGQGTAPPMSHPMQSAAMVSTMPAATKSKVNLMSLGLPDLLTLGGVLSCIL